jgi:hypothetical protein
VPIPVAEQIKARVYSSSLSGTACSNLAGSLTSVSCECCVLLDRGLCYGLIPRPDESYRLWCVIVCDLETSTMRRSWPALDSWARKNGVFMVMKDYTSLILVLITHVVRGLLGYGAVHTCKMLPMFSGNWLFRV